MRHSLFKYYGEREWAEKFSDGELLFRSLAYFRDFEDENVRGDQNEGTIVHRPKGGLVVNNLTQGTTFTLPHAFESSANPEEIFVFCLSGSLTDQLRRRFKAGVCIEILDIRHFCARITAALPSKATFPGLPRRPRIGRWVEYYEEIEGGNPRWALPDHIATSKLTTYAWQNEFRLVFSLTDALGFEKVTTRLVQGDTGGAPRPDEHRKYLVKAGSLRDICRVHEF